MTDYYYRLTPDGGREYRLHEFRDRHSAGTETE